MADVIVYDPVNTVVPGRVMNYYKSVHTDDWINTENTLINPVVPATGGPEHWKVEGGTTVVEMTQTEKDALASANVESGVANSKAIAKDYYDLTIPQSRMARGISESLLDEVNVLRSVVVGVGSGSVTYDPPSLANGAGATSTNITVPDAAFGDMIDVSAPYSLGGLIACGYVSAANTVNIRLHNATGASVNLGPGLWKVVARRIPSAMPPRTPAEHRTAIHAKIDAEP